MLNVPKRITFGRPSSIRKFNINVGSEVVIEQSSIGPNVTIDRRTKVFGSTIQQNSSIGKSCVLNKCWIGENCIISQYVTLPFGYYLENNLVLLRQPTILSVEGGYYMRRSMDTLTKVFLGKVTEVSVQEVEYFYQQENEELCELD